MTAPSRRRVALAAALVLALSASAARARAPVNAPPVGCPEKPEKGSARATASASLQTLMKSSASDSADGKAARLKVLVDWYTSSVHPRMKRATTDDSDLVCAICERIAWGKAAGLFGFAQEETRFKDKTDYALTGKEETLTALTLKALNHAFDAAYRRCVDEKDPYQGPRLLTLGKWINLMGGDLTAKEAIQAYDDCVRWTVDFESTIQFVHPATPIIESTSEFVAKDILLERIEEAGKLWKYRAKKTKYVAYEERIWEPQHDPPRRVEKSKGTLDVKYVALDLEGRPFTCEGQKAPDDEFPEIVFGYEPTTQEGSLVAAYVLALHKDEMVLDPNVMELMGMFVAKRFEKGPPGVFARKQYSRAVPWAGGTKQEETEIRIRHTPKPRGGGNE